MRINKERIEHLKSGLGVVQEGLQRMEFDMNNKLHHLEEALNRLSNMLLSNLESSNHDNHHLEKQDGGWRIISSKSAKLEFPHLSGDNSTEWFNRVEKFFEYQGMTENQKVLMIVYHLEGEATNGCSGFTGCYRKKDTLFHRKNSMRNYGLASDHQDTKTLMKLSQKSGNLER
jgi:hypothetical protein